MKIDVYKSLTSVRPFTSWRSYADMANFLEENGEIAAICKKIDEGTRHARRRMRSLRDW